MKKQLTLVLALSMMLVTACDDGIYPDDTTLLSKREPSPQIVISSIFPESAAWGEPVTIFGQNFGATIGENNVTFGGAYAEITEVQRGIIVVRVPKNLAQGDYSIILSANGQTTTSNHPCKITSK
jgi:hypothetical protein